MKTPKDLNLDTYSLSLLTAKEDVLNPRSSTNWALFAYDGLSNKLKLADSGVGGVLELTSKLHPRQPLYGLCRLEQRIPAQSHIVMIIWVGEGVDEYRRAECASHVPAIRSFFKEVHIFHPARSLDEVTEERIGTVALRVTGIKENSRARRPIPQQDTREEIVGTNYKRIIAAAEILQTRRECFWAQAEREEEERKEEERRRAMEDRRRSERERQEQERREAEQRERRMKEREQKIQEQRRLQAEAEAERLKQEQLKWAQQQREFDDEQMRRRCTHSESTEKAAEAAALVSQRKRNPREFFRQLSLSSVAAPGPKSPHTSPLTARSSYRKYHRSLTDAFLFNKSPSGTPTSPCSPKVVSPFFPSPLTPASPTVVSFNMPTDLSPPPPVVPPVLPSFTSLKRPTIASPTLPTPSPLNNQIPKDVSQLHSSPVHPQPETPTAAPTGPLAQSPSPASPPTISPQSSSSNTHLSLTAVVESLTFYPPLPQSTAYFEMDTHCLDQSEHDILPHLHAPPPLSPVLGPGLPPPIPQPTPVQTNIRPLSPTSPSRSLSQVSPTSTSFTSSQLESTCHPTMLAAPPVPQAPLRPLPALPVPGQPLRSPESGRELSSLISTLEEDEAGEREEEDREEREGGVTGEVEEEGRARENGAKDEIIEEVVEIKRKEAERGGEGEGEERWMKDKVLDPWVTAQTSVASALEEEGQKIEDTGENRTEGATDEKGGEEVTEATDDKRGEEENESSKGRVIEAGKSEQEMNNEVEEFRERNEEAGQEEEEEVKEEKIQDIIESTNREMGECDKEGPDGKDKTEGDTDRQVGEKEETGNSQERIMGDENWDENSDEKRVGSVCEQLGLEKGGERMQKDGEREDRREYAGMGKKSIEKNSAELTEQESESGVDEDKQVEDAEGVDDHCAGQIAGKGREEEEGEVESHRQSEPGLDREQNTTAEKQDGDTEDLEQDVLTTQQQMEEAHTSVLSDDDLQLEQSVDEPAGGDTHISETEQTTENMKEKGRDDREVEEGECAEEESDTEELECEPAVWHTAELKPRPSCASEDRFETSPEEEDLEAVSHSPEDTDLIITADSEQCPPRPELVQAGETNDSEDHLKTLLTPTNEIGKNKERQEPAGPGTPDLAADHGEDATEHGAVLSASTMNINVIDTVTTGDAANDEEVVHLDQ
ncbi:uncharacterized protein LOC143490262 isoform X2 [Brachyhypopomus gauderio]|uniref:uncharacterized protein LOC143490262 isoform X2 n=1 Tax=Brachyhypopomus gauderio TaxID=698409 RepID=UPI0040426EDC